MGSAYSVPMNCSINSDHAEKVSCDKTLPDLERTVMSMEDLEKMEAIAHEIGGLFTKPNTRSEQFLNALDIFISAHFKKPCSEVHLRRLALGCFMINNIFNCPVTIYETRRGVQTPVEICLAQIMELVMSKHWHHIAKDCGNHKVVLHTCPHIESLIYHLLATMCTAGLTQIRDDIGAGIQTSDERLLDVMFIALVHDFGKCYTCVTFLKKNMGKGVVSFPGHGPYGEALLLLFWTHSMSPFITPERYTDVCRVVGLHMACHGDEKNNLICAKWIFVRHMSSDNVTSLLVGQKLSDTTGKPLILENKEDDNASSQAVFRAIMSEQKQITPQDPLIPNGVVVIFLSGDKMNQCELLRLLTAQTHNIQYVNEQDAEGNPDQYVESLIQAIKHATTLAQTKGSPQIVIISNNPSFFKLIKKNHQVLFHILNNMCRIAIHIFDLRQMRQMRQLHQAPDDAPPTQMDIALATLFGPKPSQNIQPLIDDRQFNGLQDEAMRPTMFFSVSVSQEQGGPQQWLGLPMVFCAIKAIMRLGPSVRVPEQKSGQAQTSIAYARQCIIDFHSQIMMFLDFTNPNSSVIECIGSAPMMNPEDLKFLLDPDAKGGVAKKCKTALNIPCVIERLICEWNRCTTMRLDVHSHSHGRKLKDLFMITRPWEDGYSNRVRDLLDVKLRFLVNAPVPG